jgi:acetoin utilization deacetylase AcuC-like enzyme
VTDRRGDLSTLGALSSLDALGQLSTPVIWSPDTVAHDPAAEIWLGVRTPGTEVAERVHVIRDAVTEAGAPLHEARSHDDAILRRVHDPALLDYLQAAWIDWDVAGLPRDPGQDRVVPYVFPTAGFLGEIPARVPSAVHARAGRYCYDTMTLIGPGTWEAARAAVDVALTAASMIDGSHTPVAYGLCRPPGHHSSRAAFGGSCYLNNAAVSAEALLAAGHSRVAIVDIDAHHGNGTQSLFYNRADVFYGSLHVDPGAGWFPHYLGFADETGSGDGTGVNQNEPLAPGAGDREWLAALQRISESVASFEPSALVVSLGVDAAAEDPESPLQVTTKGYRSSGKILAELGLPTVAVQEGGYHLPTLGRLVVETLVGLSG